MTMHVTRIESFLGEISIDVPYGDTAELKIVDVLQPKVEVRISLNAEQLLELAQECIHIARKMQIFANGEETYFEAEKNGKI